MELRKKFLKKVKQIFRKLWSSHRQHGAENGRSVEAPTTPGQQSNGGTRPLWTHYGAGRDIRGMPMTNTSTIEVDIERVPEANGEARSIASHPSCRQILNSTYDAAGVVNPVAKQNMEVQSSRHSAADDLEGDSERIVTNNSGMENTKLKMWQKEAQTVLIEKRCVQSEETTSKLPRATPGASAGSPNPRPNVSIANDDQGVTLRLEQPASMTMFNGLQNASINGGTFIQNVLNSDRRGFILLQKRVATSAFHNAAQRVDPPRCHPNTRVAIQQQIYDWILSSLDERQAWIMWLHGAAGAGKSAIMQSIAELCVRDGIAVASFFFIRTDTNRNNMDAVFATIVYQLIQNIPQIQDEIFTVIERNPLIFDQSQEFQLQQLIIRPLLHLPIHLQNLFMVFIDGLDECNNRIHQSSLIKLLANMSRSRKVPVIFLIASRREPQIEAAFVHKQVSDLLQTLPLDNSDIEQTSDDVRLFLTDKFKEIHETHLRRHLLPADWPPPSAVEETVAKSSGQFIYASVVINYVFSPRANPAHRLEIVRGIRLRDASSQNPFAHLDALYQHIFSQVEALEKMFDILAFVLITGHNSISSIEQIFRLEAGELEIYLADLTAIIQCSGNQLKFLHASLPDFLRDKTRSESYHIDVDEYRTKLLCLFLARVPPIMDPLSPTRNVNAEAGPEFWWLTAIRVLLEKANASHRLERAFLNFRFSFTSADTAYTNGLISVDILTFLRQMDFNDAGQVYRHVLELFAAAFAVYWPLTGNPKKDSAMLEYPDLLISINKICRTKTWHWLPR